MAMMLAMLGVIIEGAGASVIIGIGDRSIAPDGLTARLPVTIEAAWAAPVVARVYDLAVGIDDPAVRVNDAAVTRSADDRVVSRFLMLVIVVQHDSRDDGQAPQHYVARRTLTGSVGDDRSNRAQSHDAGQPESYDDAAERGRTVKN